MLRLKAFEMLLEQGRMEGKVEEKHSVSVKCQDPSCTHPKEDDRTCSVISQSEDDLKVSMYTFHSLIHKKSPFL